VAKKFLVPIDLTKNGLFNASLHPSGTAPSTPVEGQMWYDTSADKLKVYNGSAWVVLADENSTGVTSVTGTANEVTVSGTGAGPYTGAITVGLPDDVTITNDLGVGGDLTVTGNLTVSGTTTTVNSETVTVADNIVVLNSNVTGSPTENAGIEVERGTSTNAALTWNETSDKWTAGLAGSEVEISLAGHTHAISDVTGLQDALDGKSSTSHNHSLDSLSNVTITSNSSGEILKWNGSAWINNTLSEAGIAAASHTHSLSAITDVTASASELNILDGATLTTTELNYVDGVTSAIQDQLNGKAATSHTHSLADVTDVTASAAEVNILDGATLTTTELNYVDGVTSAIQTQLNARTQKYSANIGNGALTSIAVTHGLGTRDVVVNVYDAATYDTIECDVVRTDTNNVTLGFTVAPATDSYRVVIVG
jgi:hypothetical protein